MYPAVVSSEVLDHACKEANHKASLVEYEICARVEHIMKGNIVEAMDLDWLAEIEDKVIGFVGKTAVGMLEHLHMWGGTIDFIYIKELLVQHDSA